MPLTRNEDHIVGSSGVDCFADGGLAIELEVDLGAAAGAATDGLGNGSRILTARIIGGDPHAIGESLGNLAHDRTFKAISIAPATKDSNQTSTSWEDVLA